MIRYLIDLQLKYKFWLLNAVSFVGMLILVLVALMDYRQGILQQAGIQIERTLQLLLVNAGKPSNPQLSQGLFLLQDHQLVWQGEDIDPELLRQRLRVSPPEHALVSDGLAAQSWANRLWADLWGGQGSGQALRYLVVRQQGTQTAGAIISVPSLWQLSWEKWPYYASAVLALMLAILFFSQMLIQFVSKPMQQLRDAMHKVQRDGDLRVKVVSRSKDEVGQMTDAFNSMVKDLGEIVTEIRTAAMTMDVMSKNLVTEVESNAGSIEVQKSEAGQLVQAMAAMVTNNQAVRSNAADNNQRSQTSVAVAKDGNEQVEFVVAAINRLAVDIREGADAVEKLAQETGSITAALDVINEIAEQTNLLALNAAIEAARAGEQGRGFAVVAEEVRNLARRVQHSTEQIKVMLDRLLQSSTTAVQVMNARSDEARSCVYQADNADKVIHEIAAIVQSMSDANGEIASSIDHQTATVEEVNVSITKLSDEMESLSDSVSRNAGAAQILAELSGRMTRVIEHLKL